MGDAFLIRRRFQCCLTETGCLASACPEDRLCRDVAIAYDSTLLQRDVVTDSRREADMKPGKHISVEETRTTATGVIGLTLLILAIVALSWSLAVAILQLEKAKNDIEEIKTGNAQLRRMLLDVWSPGKSDNTEPDMRHDITGADIFDMRKGRHTRSAQDPTPDCSMTTKLLRLHIRNSCRVLHNEKCFVAIIKELRRPEAIKICNGLGGHMANIYNKAHLDQLLKYIPYASKEIEIKEIILGMTYDTEAMVARLWDGKPAPFVKWLGGGWPIRLKGFTQINLRVNANPEATHLGMFNSESTGKRYQADGVLCEF